MILVTVSSFAVQGLVVKPNESIKEKPYLEHNIKFTKEAHVVASSSISGDNVILTLDNSESITVVGRKLWKRPLK